MEVFVIRHTPVSIASGICYGQTDVGLDTDKFPSYLQAYQDLLPATITQTISSPLQRCQALASSLNRGLINTDERLKEIHFGQWENIAWNDIPPAELLAWTNNFVEICPPDGENLAIVFQRLKQFLDELRLSEAPQVLLVTHGGVIRCILSYLLDIPLANVFKVPVGYGELLTFQLGKLPTDDFITRLK